MSYYPEFATLLDQYLGKSDRSAAWLAQRIGVNPGTVTRWRNGDTRPNSPEVVIKIADILNVYDPKDRQRFLHAAGYGYLESSSGNTYPLDTQVERESLTEDTISTTTPLIPSETLGHESVVDINDAPTTLVAKPYQDPHSKPIAKQNTYHPLVRVIMVAGIVSMLAFIQSASQPIRSTQASVQRFAIKLGEEIPPSLNSFDRLLGDRTRRILYQKLSLSPSLQGVMWEVSEISPKSKISLDYRIVLHYQLTENILLTAEIYDQQGDYLTSVEVKGEAEEDSEAEVCYLDLQNRLAEQILQAIDISTSSEINKLISTVPTSSCDALKLNNRAAELIIDDKVVSAQDILERVLKIDPNYADAYNNLGRVYYHQLNWLEAIRRTRQAIELQPRNAIYFYNLGLTLERSGNYTEAITTYQQAISLDPLYVQALNNLGFTWLEMNEVEKASEVLLRGFELAPDAPYLLKNMGRVYLLHNEPGNAIQLLKKAISLSPNNNYPEAYYYLSLAYKKLDVIEDACTTLLRYAILSNQDDQTRAEQAEKLFAEWQCAMTP